MKQLRILIVDDEALIRMDLSEILTDAGHIVVGEGKDGEEAVSLARQTKPDLVIMDINMPNMDGITAAKMIDDEKLAPVLLLTAYSQSDIVEKAGHAGVMGYLVKPIREEQLFPSIEIAVTRFKEYQAMDDELGSLKESLESRKLIEKAKGILMQAHGLSEEAAFSKMRQYSMMKRISIKQLAEQIIASQKNFQ